MAEALKSSTTETLYLHDNEIGDQGAEALLLQLCAVVRVLMKISPPVLRSRNELNLDSENMMHLQLPQPKIEWLQRNSGLDKLSFLPIGDSVQLVVEPHGRFPPMCFGASVLRVSILSIPTVARHRVGQALAESLKSNGHLKCLFLYWNNIGDRGAEAPAGCPHQGWG